MSGARLSILTATHERRELLRSSLDALGRQTQPPRDFEVVVIVDGSRDGTLEMLADYRASAPYRLLFEYQENSGKPAAINRAARLASAPYCLVLDDDMTAEPQLVAEHLRLQEGRGGVIGVGPMRLRLPPTTDGMTQWFMDNWQKRYERLRRAPDSLDYKRCFGGNLSFPRAAFLEVGGWTTDIPRGGDIELGYRLERHGLPVVCAVDGWATQEFPGGLRHIAWNAERSGRGALSTYAKHPETLPVMVGHFRETTVRSFLLREALLLTRPSARLLALADPVVRKLPESASIYATIHSYFLWRGIRRSLGADQRWRALRRGTVILAYGGLQEDGNWTGRPLVRRAAFSLQMGWLKRRGYRVMSLDEYVRERTQHLFPRPRSVIVTFDGDHRDFATTAQPILARLGLPATVFLDVTAANPPQGPPHRSPLTRQEMIGLAGDGLRFGLQGRGETPSSSLARDRAVAEIAGARKALETALGSPVLHFAYPLEADDGEFARLAEEAGFQSACGSAAGANGPATPIYALRRARVGNGLSLAPFLLSLWTGYSARGTRRTRAGEDAG